jgi:hypothetical protein
VLYFGEMERDPLRETVAVAIDNIADLRREQDRQRDKLHHLESTIHGVRMLTKAVDELQESMPNLARRAAKEAVEEARRARHRDIFSNLRTYAAVASVGVALGALIVGLVLR